MKKGEGLSEKMLQLFIKYLINSFLRRDQMSCAKCEVVVHFASASVYIELDQLDVTIVKYVLLYGLFQGEVVLSDNVKIYLAGIKEFGGHSGDGR